MKIIHYTCNRRCFEFMLLPVEMDGLLYGLVGIVADSDMVHLMVLWVIRITMKPVYFWLIAIIVAILTFLRYI